MLNGVVFRVGWLHCVFVWQYRCREKDQVLLREEEPGPRFMRVDGRASTSAADAGFTQCNATSELSDTRPSPAAVRSPVLPEAAIVLSVIFHRANFDAYRNPPTHRARSGYSPAAEDATSSRATHGPHLEFGLKVLTRTRSAVVHNYGLGPRIFCEGHRSHRHALPLPRKRNAGPAARVVWTSCQKQRAVSVRRRCFQSVVGNFSALHRSTAAPPDLPRWSLLSVYAHHSSHVLVLARAFEINSLSPALATARPPHFYSATRRQGSVVTCLEADRSFALQYLYPVLGLS